eukprot:CAMPEP_0198153868 /NCGR_PEP_ID=MMETSP1443-20131203/66135_1 /TAXON_ID=186043 /ORGANISM="Entomoneis sp., Strain CCMP2396" /LENGTH=147 /DNA_ID=CAMNT_0043820361 /DNA_START=77 /DNA_END=517 /DNA_ORIENTATION=+
MSDPRHHSSMRSAGRSSTSSPAAAYHRNASAYSHNSSNSSWIHPHNLSEPTPSSEHLPPPQAIDQGPPPSRHQEAVAAGHRLDIHLEHLQEDLQHEKVTRSQKSKLYQKNLDNLRGLVKEVQADDWKYAGDNNDSLMAGYFTHTDAW